MQWKSRELIAWTNREGPQSPKPIGGLFPALAVASLGVVFVGFLASDVVCAEHRAWVSGLAAIASFSSVASIIGFLRHSYAAPFLALATSLTGVTVGFIDAVHAPTRGSLIALGFGVVLALTTLVCLKFLRASLAERQLNEELTDPSADELNKQLEKVEGVGGGLLETRTELEASEA